MTRTRRQLIREMVEAAPAALRDVATEFRLKLKDAVAEVEHAARSASPKRLQIVRPSECGACGFGFRDRVRLTAPSRCPKCRSEDTSEPLFQIR